MKCNILPLVEYHVTDNNIITTIILLLILLKNSQHKNQHYSKNIQL